MDIDTIKVEAHYAGLLNERCRMILDLNGQVEQLTRENADIKARLEALSIAQETNQ